MAPGPRHILDTLVLPDRYEKVAELVGDDVAKLLTKTEDSGSTTLDEGSYFVEANGRGLFAPLVAKTGTGKTTLVTNLHNWYPNRFTPTVRYTGSQVTNSALASLVRDLRHSEHISPADGRCIPINIDDREARPPDDEELSEIKAFLRSEPGSKAIVLWLMTDQARAAESALYYERMSGMSPIRLPISVGGPPPSAWPQIALTTLHMCNEIDDLNQLGVDPRTYNPGDYDTIGSFLAAISSDFARMRIGLVKSTERKLRLMVLFVSESRGNGVLSELTSGKSFGLVDPEKLLSASPDSAISRWWKARRGALVRTVVGLDARAVGVSPATVVPIVRRYGPPDAVRVFEELAVQKRTETEIEKYFVRSDPGKLLQGTSQATSVNQGNPGDKATESYQYLGEMYGFNAGKDKPLNRALADHLRYLSLKGTLPSAEVSVETRIPFVHPIIPDVMLDDATDTNCLELHWRTGEFLTTGNRSEVAQYVLSKLKSYALGLEWAEP